MNWQSTVPQDVVGEIRPGRHQTREGKEVYIKCRCNVTPDGAKNFYPWWVENGKRGWSVDTTGRHLKNGVTPFDIVSRVDALPPPKKD